MSEIKPFDFKKARRITPAEVEKGRKAIENTFGIKRPPRKGPGRPPKSEKERTQAISIRLPPEVIAWAKREAKKEGVGYQTIISRALKELAG